MPIFDDKRKIQELCGNAEARTRWVFCGDSITHGAFHTFGHRDYVEHFAERLRYELNHRFDTVLTTATSGRRLRDLKAELDWAALMHAPHVVSINIGMNDCGYPEAVEEFRRDYLHVIAAIRKQTSAALMLHTPNGILPADVRRSANIDRYFPAIRDVAEETGALLIDHHAYWEAARQRRVMEYWLSDAIHPNEYGHRAMAQLLIRELGLWDDASHVCKLLVP